MRPPLPSGQLDFEAFDEGTAPPLPDGEYQLVAAALVGLRWRCAS